MKLAVARLLFRLGVIFVFVTARLGNALPGGPTTVKVWLLIFRSHAVAIGRLPSNANTTTSIFNSQAFAIGAQAGHVSIVFNIRNKHDT